MEPGTVNGDHYDGRMVEIIGNHVALVPAGRAGPDVCVGDSKPNLNVEGVITMSNAMSRRAAMAEGAVFALHYGYRIYGGLREPSLALSSMTGTLTPGH